ncbi:MAG: hypothetical protein HY914_20910 [Desulfomonile tiedjei]|nr:hypothetical protein [Desulfomonile tiedjei]
MKPRTYSSGWMCASRATVLRVSRFLVSLAVLLSIGFPAAAQDKDGLPPSATVTTQQTAEGTQQPAKPPAPNKASKAKVIQNNGQPATAVRVPKGDPPTSTELNSRMRNAIRTDQNISRTMRQLDATTRDMRRDLGRIQRLDRLNRLLR